MGLKKKKRFWPVWQLSDSPLKVSLITLHPAAAPGLSLTVVSHDRVSGETETERGEKAVSSGLTPRGHWAVL